MKRISKLATFVVSLCFVSNVYAAEHAGLKCMLQAGKGPFSEFTLTPKPSVAITAKWTEESGAEEQYAIASIKRLTQKGINQSYYFEAGSDWGAGQIILSDDDDSLHAFVSFSSDSGGLSGYYNCKQ